MKNALRDGEISDTIGFFMMLDCFFFNDFEIMIRPIVKIAKYNRVFTIFEKKSRRIHLIS